MNTKNNHLFLLIATALTIALTVTVYSIVDSPKYKSLEAVEISTAMPVEEADNEIMRSETKININTATAEELEKLENIGRKKALAIVEYREANGPFKSVEELANVDGIGETTIELNIERIIF